MKSELFKTEQFEANIGIIPGYFQDQNEDVAANFPKELIKVWDDVAEQYFTETGLYVSCTVHPVKTLYRKEWGCPSGGEHTILVTGVRHPKFTTLSKSWRVGVERVVSSVANRFQQETAYLFFREVDFLYLTKS